MSNDSFRYTPDAGSKPVPIPKGKPAAQADTSAYAQVPWGPLAAVLFSLIVYFSAQMLGSLLVIAYPHLKGWDNKTANEWLDNSVMAQFWFVLSAETLTFSATWWFIRAKGAAIRAIGWRWPRWKDPVYTLSGFAAYFVAYTVLAALAVRLFPQLNVNQKQDIGFTSIAGHYDMLLAAISLVLLPPLVEETVFRGFMFTGLRTKLSPIWAGLFTSLLFGMAHLEFGTGKPLLWIAAIDTFTLSCVLCYLRHKTDSLWPGIFLHMLKNGVAFISVIIIGGH